LFVCLWYLGLSSGLSSSATPPAFFCEGFFKIGLANYLPGLASNCDLPDLCSLSS
jgi:hypothetical protein